MLSSRYRFFLAVSLFCLTNQYKGSSAREPEPRLDPRKWKLRSTQIGVGEASGAPAKQHDATVTKLDRTMLGIHANTQSPAVITDDVFESGNQQGADTNKHSYVSGLGRNDRPHRAQMRRRHGHSVVKSRRRRFRRGIFTTTLGTQFETNNIADKGNRIDSEKSYERGITINMTLSVPKLEMCVHICLSNTLCTKASFHAEKSTCTLTGNGDDRMEEKRQRVKDKNDEIENKWRGSIDIKIRLSENGETKTFRINKSKLKGVIGKCVGKVCPNRTFCSATATSNYTCLHLNQFLGRLQKRYARPAHDVDEPEDHLAHVGELTREKRSLKPERQRRLLARKRKSKVKRNVDCGIPPLLKNALSLFTSTTLGSTATYYCEEGIRTTMKNTIIYCRPDGKWSQPGFYCIPQKNCRPPRKIRQAVMHFYELNRKNLVIYQCINKPERNALTICNSSDGTWSDIELDCSDPHSDQFAPQNPKQNQVPFNSSKKRDPGDGMQTDSKQVFNDAVRRNTSNIFNSDSGNFTRSTKKSTKQNLEQVAMSKRVTALEFMTKLPSKYELFVGKGKDSDKSSKESLNEYPEMKLSNNILGQFSKSKFTKTNAEIGYHGKIRVNVNTDRGTPGLMCSSPLKLTFASAFYESKNIGSKAIFKCKTYFFGTPDSHCPIITCLNQGIWSELYLSCSDLDCVNPPSIYEGRRICSSSGYECRRWDEAVTDPEAIATFRFPEKNISKANNYCRDPLNQGTPWCFTKNPMGIWDYCDVPRCP